MKYQYLDGTLKDFLTITEGSYQSIAIITNLPLEDNLQRIQLDVALDFEEWFKEQEPAVLIEVINRRLRQIIQESKKPQEMLFEIAKQVRKRNK